MTQDIGVPPSGSGHSPKGGAASSTASPAKPSVPNADAQAHRAAIASKRLWDDEISTLVDWAFTTVSRNPSDHEVAVAYRRAIASVLHHARRGWKWEHGSFMGSRGWMWRRPAEARSDATGTGAAEGESAAPQEDAQ